MNDLMKFNYGEEEVRTILVDDEPWFVAKDVCDILQHSNSRQAVIDMVDEEDVTKAYTPHPQSPEKKLEVIVVNESGLYTLILRSNLPKAKPFKRWVTHDVLPSIRKTGSYGLPQQSDGQDPVTAMLLQASMLMNKRQIESEKRITLVEEAQARTATAESYFTIMGFANLCHFPVNRIIAASLGKKASHLCRENGYLTYSTPDPRFGRVKTYPKEILEIVFKQ